MNSQHDNKFVARIYEEFEDKLWHAFQIDFNKLKTVLDRPEDDDHGTYSVEEKLRASFEEGGAVQLRHHMNSVIINLEYILLSRELERAATYNEWVESVESLDIGLGRDDMDPAYLNGVQQASAW